MDKVNQDAVPKFDHRFGTLSPSAWLKYFESVADANGWSDRDRSIKLVSKVDGSLQEALIKAFNLSHEYSDVREKFLETKINTKDCIAILNQQYDPRNQNLKIFLKYKREAAKSLTRKSEDQIYVEAVRRSLPAAYQFIDSVEDVEKMLAEQLKQDKDLPKKVEKVSDKKKEREIFRNKRFELMKQAYQLSKESDCKVALIILDKENVLSQYSTDCMESILTKYLKHEYSSKRHFTNHNIELAMSQPKSAASEAASTNSPTGEHPANASQASSVQTREPTLREPSLTPEAIAAGKAAELQRLQQQQMEDAVNQLNNLKLGDKPNNAHLMNSVVHKIASMTDNPIEFWNRYLVYYGLLMHVYQLDQISANPGQNPVDPANPISQTNPTTQMNPTNQTNPTNLINPIKPSDAQDKEDARSTMKEPENSTKQHPEEHSVKESETKKADANEDTEDAEDAEGTDESSDDDFCFVDPEKSDA